MKPPSEPDRYSPGFHHVYEKKRKKYITFQGQSHPPSPPLPLRERFSHTRTAKKYKNSLARATILLYKISYQIYIMGRAFVARGRSKKPFDSIVNETGVVLMDLLDYVAIRIYFRCYVGHVAIDSTFLTKCSFKKLQVIFNMYLGL